MLQDSITALTEPVSSSPDGGLNTVTQYSTTVNVPTFEELHEQYQAYVRWRVCHLLHYRNDLIDEAIQETWIKVWRFLPGIDSTRNLKAWLWLIATNTVRDIMRHHKTYELHYYSLEATLEHFDISADDYRNAVVPDPHDYIPEQLERQALRSRIWAALSATDKATFAAYVENGQVVKQRLYAARRNFGDRYKRAEKRQEVAS